MNENGCRYRKKDNSSALSRANSNETLQHEISQYIATYFSWYCNAYFFFWYCNAFYLEEKKRLNNHHKISRGTKHGWCICKQEAWRPTCIPKISGQSGPFIIYCILTSKSAVARNMPPVDWKWTRSRLIFLVCESYKKPFLYIIIFWSFTEQQNDCLSLYQGGIFFQLLFIPCCFWCSLENFE